MAYQRACPQHGEGDRAPESTMCGITQGTASAHSAAEAVIVPDLRAGHACSLLRSHLADCKVPANHHETERSRALETP